MVDLITEMELDSIKETLSQGAGSASTALSQMSGEKVEVHVPQLNIVKVEEITKAIGEPTDIMMSVYVRVSAEIDGREKAVGSLLLVFPPKSASNLSAILIGEPGRPEKDLNELDEMDVSALHEVANILTGCALSAVSDFLQIHLIEGVPTSSRDMLAASMDVIIVQLAGQVDNSMIFETKYEIANADTEAVMYLVFEPDAVELIRNRINEMFG